MWTEDKSLNSFMLLFQVSVFLCRVSQLTRTFILFWFPFLAYPLYLTVSAVLELHFAIFTVSRLLWQVCLLNDPNRSPTEPLWDKKMQCSQCKYPKCYCSSVFHEEQEGAVKCSDLQVSLATEWGLCALSTWMKSRRLILSFKEVMSYILCHFIVSLKFTYNKSWFHAQRTVIN